MYRVKVYPLSENKAYVSQIYAGLFDLAALGKIDLRFTWFPSVRIHNRNGTLFNPTNRSIFYLEASDRYGKKRKICYDLQDGTDISSIDGLEKCDVYFKRSYLSDFIRSSYQISKPEWRNKIQPYGLNYPCRSPFEFGELKRISIFNTVTGAYWRNSYKALKQTVKAAVNMTRSTFRTEGDFRRTAKSIEHGALNIAEPLVLFQTRLFNPVGATDSDQRVRMNRVRIDTLQALKNAFGKRLIGGLIPNDYTIKNYPELLNLHTKEPVSRTHYVELVKRCLIGVFTLGTMDSNGWRLPEYLAMSRCIVSEPLKYSLPEPLNQNTNCIFFSNPEECVDACRKILDDPSFAQEMRENNFKYYCEHVKPSSIIMKSLDDAMQM